MDRNPDSEALLTAGRVVAALAAVAVIFGVVARRVVAMARSIVDFLSGGMGLAPPLVDGTVTVSAHGGSQSVCGQTTFHFTAYHPALEPSILLSDLRSAGAVRRTDPPRKRSLRLGAPLMRPPTWRCYWARAMPRQS